MAKRGPNVSSRRSQREFPSIERSGPATRAGNPRPAVPRSREVTVVERFGTDEDGVPLARPLAWPGPDPAPILRLVETGLTEPFPIGARAAARLVSRETGVIEARIIRMLGPAKTRIVGVYYRGLQGGRVVPADRRNRTEYRVTERDGSGAEDGELVAIEELPTGRLGSPASPHRRPARTLLGCRRDKSSRYREL